MKQYFILIVFSLFSVWKFVFEIECFYILLKFKKIYIYSAKFIQTEALVDDNNQQSLRISDDELDERMADELDDFVDNSFQGGKNVSFYRQLGNDQFKFPNQIKESIDSIFEQDTTLYEIEDLQSELYGLEDINFSDFW